MAEIITLDLELIDKVGGPAKAATQALRRIEQQQQRAQQQVNKTAIQQAAALEKSAQGWVKIAAAAEKAKAREEKASSRSAAQAEKLATRQAAAVERSANRQAAAVERAKTREAAAIRRTGLMQMQANKMNEAVDKKKNAGFFGSFKEKLAFRSVGDYTKGAFWGHIAAEGAMKIGEGFLEGAKKSIEFLADGVKKAFEAGGRSESQRLGYKLAFGSQSKADAFEKDTQRMSGISAFNELDIGAMLTPLIRSGFSEKSARSAFAAATDIAAAEGRGGDMHAVEEITAQLARVQLQGSIDRQHLVALGINSQTFYKDLAKKLHTTEKDVKEKGSEGKLDPTMLLNSMYEQIERRQGGKLGSGGQAARGTMDVQLARLSSLPEVYLARMSQSPAWGKLTNKLEGVLQGLDPDGPRGKKIITSLFTTFNRLADWISKSLTPQSIDKFAAGVERALGMLSRLPETLNTILKISESFAVVWAGKQLVDGIVGATKALEALSVVSKLATGGGSGAGGSAATKLLGAGAGVAAAALLLDGEQQGADMDSANAALVDSGQRRKIEHWWGDTYEDTPGPAAAKAGANVTVKVDNINVVAAPGEDGKVTGAKVGEGLSATTIRQMERAAQERGGG